MLLLCREGLRLRLTKRVAGLEEPWNGKKDVITNEEMSEWASVPFGHSC